MEEDILEAPEPSRTNLSPEGIRHLRVYALYAVAVLACGGIGYAIGKRTSSKSGGAIGAVVGAGVGAALIPVGTALTLSLAHN